MDWSGESGIVRDDRGSLFDWGTLLRVEFRKVAGGGIETIAGTVTGTLWPDGMGSVSLRQRTA